MTRTILHIDMDAFFASVEIREYPELAGRPVIVGGRPEGRGVVSAASYEARRFGVHSAMPTATALRLCPEAVLLPPRHGLYAEVGGAIREIFHRYTPEVEPLSLDEAFLDVTASLALFGDGPAIGARIKETIRAELGLVASVGIAPNKFLAKLASDADKPDGFVVVGEEGVQAFLDPLPIRRLWGVGAVTAGKMERLGIGTVGQLRGWSARLLEQHFGQQGEHFWRLARGLDERPVVTEREARSISHETTFPVDITDCAVLTARLLELTEQVGERLRAAGLQGRTIRLKVRHDDFRTLTRAVTLDAPTDSTGIIWQAVRGLFEQRLPAGHRPVRLVGVGVGGFDGTEAAQGELFNEPSRHRAVDAVADAIRGRFGDAALRRAGTRREPGHKLKHR